MARVSMSWRSAGQALTAQPAAEPAEYFSTAAASATSAATAKFTARDVGQRCVLVSCRGGLSWDDRDRLAPALEEYLAQHGPVAGVILDLAAVEFVNSAGLGALFTVVQRLRARDERVVFTHVPPMLMRLFHAVGLDRLARVTVDLPGALKLLRPRSADEHTGDALAPLTGQPARLDS